MPQPTFKQGTVKTIMGDYAAGTLEPAGSEVPLGFTNPVRMELTPGEGVTYLEITHPVTGAVNPIITGKS